jgi:hypothetical protein
MKAVIGIILALVVSTAAATGNSNNSGTHCNGNGSCGTTNNYSTTNAPQADAKATAITTQGQSQGQHQGQAQGQLQGQVQGQIATGGTATNAGNAQSTTITFEDRKQAPGVAVAATTTTASCRVAVSMGVSGPGFAVGGGTAYKDEKCDKRALGLALIDAARVAQGLGAPAEVFAPIFMEGMTLLRASGSDDDSNEPVTKTTSQPATPVSYVQ